MADYDSSLPIRTEAAGDVDVFISDSVTPSQKLKVNADGSIDSNIATGAKIIITDGTDDVEVNADGSVNAVVSATDLDIRDLGFATDSVDVSGSSVTVSATDLDIRDLSESTDSVTAHQGGSWTVTATATDLDIRDLVFATDKVDVSGSSVTVSATDLDIRDLDAASDSVAAHLFDEAGVAFSSSNPLPVEFFESQAEAFSYHAGDSIAKDATSTQTYAAPSGFKVKDVYVSGSGKMKAELKINSVTVAVGFNSTANPNINFRFQKGLNASGVNVEVVKTNLDNQAQNLYSTIVGLS
jgi:hypothetical protein